MNIVKRIRISKATGANVQGGKRKMTELPKGFAWMCKVPQGHAVACLCGYMTTDSTGEAALDAMKRLHTCTYSEVNDD